LDEDADDLVLGDEDGGVHVHAQERNMAPAEHSMEPVEHNMVLVVHIQVQVQLLVDNHILAVPLLAQEQAVLHIVLVQVLLLEQAVHSNKFVEPHMEYKLLLLEHSYSYKFLQKQNSVLDSYRQNYDSRNRD
jgi:hypothetical protein